MNDLGACAYNTTLEKLYIYVLNMYVYVHFHLNSCDELQYI